MYLIGILICISLMIKSFHIPVVHLYAIFGKKSTQVIFPFLKLDCLLLLLSCMDSFYILDIACMLSHFSCVQPFATLWTLAHVLCPWDSPGKKTGVSCCALLQGIFPTQGSNLGLLVSFTGV